MKQYESIKAVHPDAVLLFRVGDFYETFGEDAIKASGILGITLTRRANGAASFVELAGFPYHSLDTYLPKLVRAGERVAICEQLEDPKTVKGIVKRGVIELVTPGIALNDNILEHKQNTFLASVYFGDKSVGLALLDISTGEFYVSEGSEDYVDKLISNFRPKEIIYQRSCEGRFRSLFRDQYYSYKLDEWIFSKDINREKLCKQLEVSSLKGFGIDNMTNGIAAAGAILYYLDFTEHKEIAHIKTISRIDEDKYVWIDRFTIRNLELFASGNLKEKTGFIDVIDKTRTGMGSRLLKKWIALPIKDIGEINERLDIVEHYLERPEQLEEIRELLDNVSDLERIVSRLASLKVLPREVMQLKNSLDAIVGIKEHLGKSDNPQLRDIGDNIDGFQEVRSRIEREMLTDPSNQILKGGVIARGVDMELDDLRGTLENNKDIVAGIQQRESEITGIPSLKVGFNNVFGYYIEVRNTYKERVPPEWIRKQTLTSAERYITSELKIYEEKILGAEEKIIALEQRIYNDLIEYLCRHLVVFQRCAQTVSRIDCLTAFAYLAGERNYCRPLLDDSKVLDITEARHPVIETMLPVGESYIPNDIYLDDDTQQIMMITGPNMAGKSALLRQTALIVLMAQIGCFVPANSARIGIVDKIFTRVGASDNISQGESTFMVEMLESASILNNISDRSLLLLDEIGRGTSTYDGISIAWSMVEYLHGHRTRPKTMFATHYHELNELEEFCPRVRNYNVSVKEVDRTIVFLRKLVPGGTEHSFGIHVAKMAGMPAWVTGRAEEILRSMESMCDTGGAGSNGTGLSAGKNKTIGRSKKDKMPVHKQANSADFQLSMFQLDDPVLKQIRDEIRGLEINSLTPLEALNKLSEIKKITGI